MKGVRRAVVPLCAALALIAEPAAAQTNAPDRAVRRYDSRIQMHTAPVTVQVPDREFEIEGGVPKASELDAMRPTDLLQGPSAPSAPRPRVPQEKQQSKNWLLPLSPDAKIDEDETAPGAQKETLPSGWGWLADDVRARQKKEEKDSRKESESEEKYNDYKPRSVFQKEDLDPAKDNIFLDTAFKPVSSSTPDKEDKETKLIDDMALTPGQEMKKDLLKMPIAADKPADRPAVEEPRERKFGADAAWGNESLWSKNAKPVSMLPQTEALLSESKRDAAKPIEGWSRPAALQNIQAPAAAKPGVKLPEPPPREVVTAPIFQPIPAPPVNELGSASWDAAAPAKAPLGMAAPLFAEPKPVSALPSSTLKAPELPKPADSPWLK